MTPHDMNATLSAGELKAFLNEHPDTLLLDVLPPDHFQQVHIPGAENACVFFASFLDDLAAIIADTKRKIVVYGSSERSHDAKTAVEKMLRAGYPNVYALAGGLEAWRQAGYQCAGQAPDQPLDPQRQLALPDGEFTIDTEQSGVRWQGRNATTSHNGTLAITEGEIHCDDGSITGKVEGDMQSIRNLNLAGDEMKPVLEAHLASDDFFFTSMFPKAVLNIDEATPIEPRWQTSPNFQVRATLQLRGVSASLEFEATVSLTDDNTMTLEAHFDIDRTRWNIIYGSTRFFEHLGMHKVFDAISLQVRITASR